MLASALDEAGPNEIIVLVVLADGVEAVVLRTTEAIVDHRGSATVSAQIATGGTVSYGKYLSWRQMVAVEPPNRPAPNRPSASAAHRREAWKFGFVGTRDRSSQMVHLPPARVSEKGGAVDDMEPIAMADTEGTIASFTVDKLVYSPSPPVVFAVVDFDGGGRVPLELTDVAADEVEVGWRVEPTFQAAVHERRDPQLLLESATSSQCRPRQCRQAPGELMGSHGIKDQVAIIGVGCTRFAEHWDSSLDDLIIDGAQATYASAGVAQDDIDAFWFGTSQSAASGLAMGGPLKIHGKPITRVENYCATGSEAMRQAAYAVASGAYDLVMALGAEKVKDGGYQGLNAFPIPTDGTQRTLTAAAMFSLILPAYAAKYSIDEDDLRYAVAKIAEKNHYNGARNPLAQFRRETSAEQICQMAAVAGRLVGV